MGAFVDVRRRISGVRGRATIGAVVVVGAALFAGSVGLVQAQRRTLTADLETSAVARATDLAAAITEGTLPQDLVSTHPDEALVQVVDNGGGVVAATTNITGKGPIVSLAAPDHGHTELTTRAVPVGDSPFLVVAVRATYGGSTYTVYVGKSLESEDRSVASLVRLLSVGAPLLLLLVGIVAWTVMGRALRPVEAIRTEVETISTRDLHRRVPEPASVDEIGLLARTMNRMLERLDNANERQQRFVADASHELRSPLAAIRAQLEVDLAHPDTADWAVTHSDVLEETTRMQRLVEDLLLLASADHAAKPTQHRTVDLDDIVLDECHKARARCMIIVDTSGVSGGQVHGDQDQLRRAVRNVVDNAVRHAASTVTVTLGEHASAVMLQISDDGLGVAAEQHARIFERFTRLDHARSRAEGGTGLGLAITTEIIEAHNGHIHVEDAHPGARFVIELPASST